MGSLTGKLKKIRTRKRLRQGTDRKAKLRKLMNAINLQEDSLYSTEIVPPGKVREDEHE